FLFPKPAVLHTKCFIVDDTYAVMGSSNMDMRSFGLNYEISLLATGGDLVDDIIDVVADYQAASHELTLEEREKRPLARRYMESAMRLTSALQLATRMSRLCRGGRGDWRAAAPARCPVSAEG